MRRPLLRFHEKVISTISREGHCCHFKSRPLLPSLEMIVAWQILLALIMGCDKKINGPLMFLIFVVLNLFLAFLSAAIGLDRQKSNRLFHKGRGTISLQCRLGECQTLWSASVSYWSAGVIEGRLSTSLVEVCLITSRFPLWLCHTWTKFRPGGQYSNRLWPDLISDSRCWNL